MVPYPQPEVFFSKPMALFLVSRDGEAADVDEAQGLFWAGLVHGLDAGHSVVEADAAVVGRGQMRHLCRSKPDGPTEGRRRERLTAAVSLSLFHIL